MENTLEMMAEAFTDAEDLTAFAALWDIQESPVVRFRLFQLRNREYDNDFVNEQLNTIFETLDGPIETPYEDDMQLALNYVREQEEIEGAVKALLFDDEMEALAQTCRDDGEWDPPSPQVQIGYGDDPLEGPSQVRYKH
ncbi:MAG: hypothetical protein ABW072_02045 [Sedimenticola sp.]